LRKDQSNRKRKRKRGCCPKNFFDFFDLEVKISSILRGGIFSEISVNACGARHQICVVPPKPAYAAYSG
jgi:hypothetical protein